VRGAEQGTVSGRETSHFFKKSRLKSLSLVVTSVASITSGSFWAAAARGQQSKLWVRRFMMGGCCW